MSSKRFLPTAELVEPALRAIAEFIDDITGSPATNERGPAAPSTLRTVIFTDLVGHTEMMPIAAFIAVFAILVEFVS